MSGFVVTVAILDVKWNSTLEMEVWWEWCLENRASQQKAYWDMRNLSKGIFHISDVQSSKIPILVSSVFSFYFHVQYQVLVTIFIHFFCYVLFHPQPVPDPLPLEFEIVVCWSLKEVYMHCSNVYFKVGSSFMEEHSVNLHTYLYLSLAVSNSFVCSDHFLWIMRISWKLWKLRHIDAIPLQGAC